jgi:GTPase SAR1 family protein
MEHSNTYREWANLCYCGMEHVIPLPKIAVIGNQSAGKSQLIEAISQIKVPSSAGTCIRCPVELYLRRPRSDSDEWECHVSLRFDYDEGACKSGTFEFFQTKKREDIPLVLRRAQLAILNPREDPLKFRDMSPGDCDHHKFAIQFSKNAVVVKVIGAEVDLTFVDLPGIISYIEVRLHYLY